MHRSAKAVSLLSGIILTSVTSLGTQHVATAYEGGSVLANGLRVEAPGVLLGTERYVDLDCIVPNIDYNIANRTTYPLRGSQRLLLGTAVLDAHTGKSVWAFPRNPEAWDRKYQGVSRLVGYSDSFNDKTINFRECALSTVDQSGRVFFAGGLVAECDRFRCNPAQSGIFAVDPVTMNVLARTPFHDATAMGYDEGETRGFVAMVPDEKGGVFVMRRYDAGDTNYSGWKRKCTVIEHYQVNGSPSLGFLPYSHDGCATGELRITAEAPEWATMQREDADFRAMYLQRDGRLIVLSKYSMLRRSRDTGEWEFFGVFRLNPNGTLDETFHVKGTRAVSTARYGGDQAPEPGVSNITLAAPLSNGNVLLAGDLRMVGNTADPAPWNSVVMVRSDGSVVSSFRPDIRGGSANDYNLVYSILEQPDGKLLLAGNIAQVNGVPQKGVARLHADGSLDSSFSAGFNLSNLPGLPGRPNIHTLMLYADGSVLVGGKPWLFDSAGGSEYALRALSPEGRLFRAGDTPAAVPGKSPWVVAVGARKTLSELLLAAGAKVPPGSKVSGKLARDSRHVCSLRKGTVVGLRPGLCSITVRLSAAGDQPAKSAVMLISIVRP